MQNDVLFGLQEGTKVLKQIHGEMGGIDNVEKLLEESAEARAYEREISDLLGGRMSNAEEDEVEDELEALQNEVNGVKAPEVPPLPSAPSAELRNSNADQEAAQRKARAQARAREEALKRVAEPMAA